MADAPNSDKKVDEDWKRRVAEEKQAAEEAAQSAAARPPSGQAAGPAAAGKPGAAPPPTKDTRRTAGGPAPQRPDPRFLQFVQAIAAEALICLGQIPNPMTGQAEQDLGHAKGSIGTLMMLQEKTKGNLSPEEERALRQVITELQSIYVQLAG
jgi:hypothetical protein